jgi:drug/metabolite transporter (DMT)-like permease
MSAHPTRTTHEPGRGTASRNSESNKIFVASPAAMLLQVYMSTKFLIVAVTVNAVLGQLLLRRALTSLGGRAAFDALPKFVLDAIASPWMYASLAIQGLGYFLWMVLISREKLGVAAASVGAGFYILMPLCAWVVYGEALSALQWFGISLITVGVTCLSLGTP